jgi:hypothetical protein
MIEKIKYIGLCAIGVWWIVVIVGFGSYSVLVLFLKDEFRLLAGAIAVLLTLIVLAKIFLKETKPHYDD